MIDDEVVEALRSVSGPVGDPVEFFEAAQADYEECRDSGFDAFRSAFTGRGFGDAGERFVEHLDGNGGLDLLARVVEDQRADELAAVYLEQQAAIAASAAAAADDPDTAAAWQSMLADYSGYWDGAEATWPAFEEYVVYYAAEQGLSEPAQQFFARAASEDKVALFAEYGVELQLPGPAPADDATAAEPTDPLAEDALWQAAVEQFGAEWAGWDGSEEGWVAYRDWFYSATNSQDEAMYAVAYDRLQPLDELAPADRVAGLRELGLDASGAASSDAGPEAETPPAEVTPEQLQTFEAIADDPAVEGIDREVLEELVQDPAFEQRVSEAESQIDAELEAALAALESS